MTAILIDKLPDLFAFLAEKLKQKGPFIEGLQGHGVPLALLVRLFATNDTVKVSKKMSSQAFAQFIADVILACSWETEKQPIASVAIELPLLFWHKMLCSRKPVSMFEFLVAMIDHLELEGFLNFEDRADGAWVTSTAEMNSIHDVQICVRLFGSPSADPSQGGANLGSVPAIKH